MKIDHRKNYYLTIDTETANGLDCPIMYDIGGAIHDKYGQIMESFSFAIYDVYCADRELFKTAYYAEKRPIYENEIASGVRKIVSVETAKRYVRELCKEYDVKAIIAYNMPFDYRSTTNSIRYITKSKDRFFLPYGIPLYDSLKMAKDTICKQKNYDKFCKANGYITKTGRNKTTAEIVYRYISKQSGFEEEHRGIDDVMIEVEIFAKCMAQHKKMRKLAFGE